MEIFQALEFGLLEHPQLIELSQNIQNEQLERRSLYFDYLALLQKPSFLGFDGKSFPLKAQKSAI